MISWYIWFVHMVMNKYLNWYLIEPQYMKIFYLDLHLLKLVWITKNIWFVQILNEKFDLILFDSTLGKNLIWFVFVVWKKNLIWFNLMAVELFKDLIWFVNFFINGILFDLFISKSITYLFWFDLNVYIFCNYLIWFDKSFLLVQFIWFDLILLKFLMHLIWFDLYKLSRNKKMIWLHLNLHCNWE